jgi:hypothetical protein
MTRDVLKLVGVASSGNRDGTNFAVRWRGGRHDYSGN